MEKRNDKFDPRRKRAGTMRHFSNMAHRGY